MSEQESAPAVEAPAVEAAASTYERKPLNPDLVAKFVAQRKAERENTEFVPAFEQETNAPAPAVATPPPAPSGPPPEAIAEEFWALVSRLTEAALRTVLTHLA